MCNSKGEKESRILYRKVQGLDNFTLLMNLYFDLSVLARYEAEKFQYTDTCTLPGFPLHRLWEEEWFPELRREGQRQTVGRHSNISCDTKKKPGVENLDGKYVKERKGQGENPPRVAAWKC